MRGGGKEARCARAALWLLLWVAGATVAVAAAAAAAPVAIERPPNLAVGQSLEEALLALEESGLNVVFTRQLVLPDMKLLEQPRATKPRELLAELLAPHGLRAQRGAGDTWVVVLVPEAERRRPVLAGMVRTGVSLEALAGATVRVEELGVEVRAGANGRFTIGGLEPGAYTLEASLWGFMNERVEGVRVTAIGAPDVTLVLQPELFVHDEIAVRPSYLSLLSEEPDLPLSLSRNEIDNLPHLGEDVFRALSLMPGISANDVTAQFRVHGGRRDETQILLDGQELYEAHHLQDFDSALSFIAPGELNSVNLSTGAFPATHGDRMSGVLDMTTTTPSEERQTRLSVSLLSLLATSSGTVAQGRGSWLATVRRGTTDLAGDVVSRENPAFWDLFAKGEIQLDERNDLRLNLLTTGDRLDFGEVVNGESKLWRTEYSSSYAWLTHQAAVGKRLLAESRASWSRSNRDRTGIEDEEETDFEVFDRRIFEVLGGSQSWGFQASPRHSLKWGVGFKSYQVDYDYLSEIQAEQVLSAPLVVPASRATAFLGEFEGEHYEAYLSDRFSPFDPLTLELGLRYDRHTLTDDRLVSPRINAAWRMGELSVLRMSWGLFHQSHRPYELQVPDGETRFAKAERSEHWVLGYERVLSSRDRAPFQALRVEAYRRDIRDPRPRYESLFEPRNIFPEIERDRVRIAPDSSRSQGIELVLRGAVGAAFDWWVNYAYSTVEDQLGGTGVRRQIDQPQALNLDGNWRLGRKWNLNLAWRYHTGWPTTPVSLVTVEAPEEPEEPEEPQATETLLVLGRLNSLRVASYHRMDLRVSRKWQARAGQFTFFADVQNLYGRQNVAGFDHSVNEDTGELVTEIEKWAGLFPSLGISWQF